MNNELIERINTRNQAWVSDGMKDKIMTDCKAEIEAQAERIKSLEAELVMNHAKLSERKTIHARLNELGIPDTEATGKKMCLLRRLAVALGTQPHVMEESNEQKS